MKIAKYKAWKIPISMKMINRMRFKKVFTLIFFCGYAFFLQAENVVATAGGFDSNVSGSLSWTIGETFITESTNGTYVLSEGFQQPNIKDTIISASIKSLSSTFVKVYPNPFINKFNIKLSVLSFKQTYVLVDLLGNIVNEGDITHLESQLIFQSLSPNAYLLKIYQNNELLNVTKLLKQ